MGQKVWARGLGLQISCNLSSYLGLAVLVDLFFRSNNFNFDWQKLLVCFWLKKMHSSWQLIQAGQKPSALEQAALDLAGQNSR